jgi:hypothetical protein
MPNWCKNDLEVYGDIEQLKEFMYNCSYDVEGETVEFSFCGLVPEPDYEGYLNERIDPLGDLNHDLPDWYTWRINNWGTKWDTSADDISFGPESLSITFQTAWGPPEIWLWNVANQYKSLRFVLTYAEPGMDFSGRITIENGELVNEESGDYRLFGIWPDEWDDTEDTNA